MNHRRLLHAWKYSARYLLVMACSLVGCSFHHSDESIQWLDLGSTPSKTKLYTLPHQPIVMNVSSTPIFTNTDIIWRIEDSITPHTYTTYRWAVPPFLLFQQRLTDLLATGGAVLNNTDANTPLLPVLRLSLTQFEQVYAKDGQSSQGHITIQATLLDTNHHIAGSVQFTRQAPAPSQDAIGGALALRVATDQLASDLTTWLAQRLPVHSSQTSSRASPHEPSS